MKFGVAAALAQFSDYVPTALGSADASSFAMVLVMAAMISASGIPGLIVPITIVAAALFGPAPAAIAVLIGVVAGSQFLFVSLRSLGRERIAARLGPRLEALERAASSKGIFCLIGLRVVGTPHALVTGASAILPISNTQFAASTAAGMLPAICLGAGTGVVL